MSSTLAAATSRGSAGRAAGATPGQPGRGAARPPRPSLRVVTAPKPDRARAAFVALCLVLLGGGLLALLLLNTAMAGGSFRLHALQATSDQLADSQQALSQDIAVQAAPQRLAARAKALGMVPSGSPAFLRLSDGRILGVAKAATASPTPTVSPQPTATTSSTGSAKAATATTPTTAKQTSSKTTTSGNKTTSSKKTASSTKTASSSKTTSTSKTAKPKTATAADPTTQR